MKLSTTHAIIIGASSGIGEALARRLAAGGTRVALVARRGDRLEAIAAEINAEAGTERAIVAEHDVHNRNDIPQLFQEITGRLGGLDTLVYASGVLPRIAVDEYNTEKDIEIMDVNTLGAIAWCNEAARRFERLGRGRIVGIASIAADRGRRGNPVYCTSKAALVTYLEAMRNRLARFGVHVVTVKPGFIDTDQTRGLPGLFWLISADEAARQIIERSRKGGTYYVPGRWRIVGFVVRAIPSFVFRRLNI